MRHFILSIILLFTVLYSCFGQSAGYYYDTAGNKITGLIDFPGNGSILYKENKNANKTYLTVNDDISSFVVGTDSFATLKGLELSLTLPNSFVHILEDGKIKMYDFSILFGSSGSKLDKDKNYYYYLEKEKKLYKINEIGWMYNFRKIMHELLIDYPELEEEYAKKNKLNISNLRYIVEKYNSHFQHS